jgi:hypothetical protein
MQSRTRLSELRDRRLLPFAGSAVRHELLAWLPHGVRQEKLLNLVFELGADVQRLDENRYLFLIDKRSVRKLTPGARYPVTVRLTLTRQVQRKRQLTRVLCEFESIGKAARRPSAALCIRLLRIIYACLLGEPLDRSGPPRYQPLHAASTDAGPYGTEPDLIG